MTDFPDLPPETAPKILVTGAGGFIGAWMLRALLAEGYRPVVFDLKEDRRLAAEICGEPAAAALEWVCGDIRDLNPLRDAAAGTEAIIHLAGLLTPGCRANPRLGAEVNLIGLLNVFAVAKDLAHDRVLYMSSAGVYGPDGGRVPQPTTLYGAFKLAGEICATSFWEDDGMPSIGIRPYVVYGPGREIGLSAGPSLAARAVAEGRSFTIPFTGILDMIYVADVTAAFIAALGMPVRGALRINLFGQRISAADVADALQKHAGPGVTIAAQGDPLSIMLPPADDSVAALALPGWAPTLLDRGLAQTIAYYARKHGS
jgi:nucleoside-diphosphate-sugar epimerase